MWCTTDHPPGTGPAGRSARLVSFGLISVVAIGVLAGCGFRPLYASGGTGSAETLATIEIARIANRSGQKLRTMLINRMTPKGPPERPLYRLSIRLSEFKESLAIRKDEAATRANLTVSATYSLESVGTPRPVEFKGQTSSTNSYNVLQSDFATLIAENDARDRALRSIAEEIRLRVAAALSNSEMVRAAAEKRKQ